MNRVWARYAVAGAFCNKFKPVKQKAHQKVGFLAAPHHQSDVGRIISDGFATLKNFSDWILNFSGYARQVKIRTEILASKRNIK
jgi:hypothetical protein